MILMALDHTRDFFTVPSLIDPTNLAQTTTADFFTHWITHICAPTFFLLMGTGAFFSGRRRTRAALSRFLLTRGVWLVVLEVTIVRCFAYQFNVDYQVTMLLVLWALGWSLVALAALVWLPIWLVGAIGVVMIGGHNAFDTVRSASPFWAILHRPGVIVAGSHTVFAAYPLIPWIGVAAAGYSLGQLFLAGPDVRRRGLVALGTGLVAGFVLLRWPNLYGDPERWRTFSTAPFTVLSFINTNKYPPSLLFLMMTIGPALLLLRAVDGGAPRWLGPVEVYGRVPLFYFVAHFMLIHVVAVVVCCAKYGSAHWMFESPGLGAYPFLQPPGWGFSLPVVYAIWIGVVVGLYPLCRWIAAVKARRR
ncbi:MAG: DUF1624 domain-containing protein, partial [Mycobacterium sp.]|nr:DUF1624 domain-containing protein [Mycobacterium sp.]